MKLVVVEAAEGHRETGKMIAATYVVLLHILAATADNAPPLRHPIPLGAALCRNVHLLKIITPGLFQGGKQSRIGDERVSTDFLTCELG